MDNRDKKTREEFIHWMMKMLMTTPVGGRHSTTDRSVIDIMSEWPEFPEPIRVLNLLDLRVTRSLAGDLFMRMLNVLLKEVLNESGRNHDDIRAELIEYYGGPGEPPKSL